MTLRGGKTVKRKPRRIVPEDEVDTDSDYIPDKEGATEHEEERDEESTSPLVGGLEERAELVPLSPLRSLRLSLQKRG